MAKVKVTEIEDAGVLARLDYVDHRVILKHSVTFDRMQRVSALRLIGRGDRSGPGAAEEIILGDNLSFEGNILHAAGGSGGGPHTHPISEVDNLQTALDGKAPTAHSHTISNVTGLQTALDGKADDGDLASKSNVGHGHVISDVTGLQTALNGKAPTSHTHAIADSTGLQTALDAKAATAHTHAIADVTNLQTSLDGKAATGHTHTESGLTFSDNTTGNTTASAHGFCPKLSGNVAHVLRGDGTFGAAPAGGDPAGWTTIVKSANQDVTNLQNQDATELQFPVVAGNLYAVELYLFYSGSDATGDFEYRFAVSAGTMDGVGHDCGDNAADAVTNLRLTAAAAANTANVPHGCVANVAIPRPATSQFTFRHNTTNGTFKVQFGNNTAAAGRISRILKGSFLRYKQLT